MIKRKVYCETYVVADKCPINDINTPIGRVKFSPLLIRLDNDCVSQFDTFLAVSIFEMFINKSPKL